MAWPDEIVTRQLISRSKRLGAKQLRRRMTSAERLLWKELRNHNLGAHFRRQQVIAGHIVDFYCHSAGLVIELDGPIHASQKEHDVQRDEHLTNLGLRVVRFENDQVENTLSDIL